LSSGVLTCLTILSNQVEIGTLDLTMDRSFWISIITGLGYLLYLFAPAIWQYLIKSIAKLIHGIELTINDLFDLFGHDHPGGFAPDFLEAPANGLSTDAKFFGRLGLVHSLFVN